MAVINADLGVVQCGAACSRMHSSQTLIKKRSDTDPLSWRAWRAVIAWGALQTGTQGGDRSQVGGKTDVS